MHPPDPATPLPLHAARPRNTARRVLEIGACAAGLAAGIAFADPVLAAAGRTWHGFILPAYEAAIENGVFAFCM